MAQSLTSVPLARLGALVDEDASIVDDGVAEDDLGSDAVGEAPSGDGGCDGPGEDNEARCHSQFARPKNRRVRCLRRQGSESRMGLSVTRWTRWWSLCLSVVLVVDDSLVVYSVEGCPAPVTWWQK